MLFLGGGRFLMSEVPLYRRVAGGESRDLAGKIGSRDLTGNIG